MKRILVLTNIYPAPDVPLAATPVVHYFTREWIKMGYEVRVVNFASNFPELLNLLVRPFRNIITAKVGYTVRAYSLQDMEYEQEEVPVCRIGLKKIKPHSLFSDKEVNKAYQRACNYCERTGFIPGLIVSHWSNPQLQIMSMMKAKFGCKTTYIAHSATETDVFGSQLLPILDSIDTIGFRSDYIRRKFLGLHSWEKDWFYCYSGIPEEYTDFSLCKHFGRMNSFIYVGTMIQRKFPAKIIPAVKASITDNDFSITYIGVGEECKTVSEMADKCGVKNRVNLLGRLPRNEVVQQFDKNDIFVMISKGETFGLVYLEAMARGCITIASKREGFDGIIKNGENGFLCEAGDEIELTEIIRHIRTLSVSEI